MGKSKTKAKTRRAWKPRARTDSFFSRSDEDNASFFRVMVQGTSPVYAVNFDAHIKTDYNNKTRHCWQVYNKESGNTVKTVRSTQAYRLAVLWAANDPDFLRPKKRTALKAGLPSIKGKKGEHSRHRCGIEWCCNPGHIVIGSRKANEVDKHFHYFLNHPKPEVRDAFRTGFNHLCKQERLF
jgi:hypothetical protein